MWPRDGNFRFSPFASLVNPCTVHLTPRPLVYSPATALAVLDPLQVKPTHALHELGKAALCQLRSLAPGANLRPPALCGTLRWEALPGVRLACGAQALTRPRGTPGIQPPFRVPEPRLWRNGPGMRQVGGRKDPPGALETSGGLPSEISSRKGSVTTRRGAREQRCFAIRTPALLREGSERTGRTLLPAPRKRTTVILPPGHPRRSRVLVVRTLGVRAPLCV